MRLNHDAVQLARFVETIAGRDKAAVSSSSSQWLSPYHAGLFALLVGRDLPAAETHFLSAIDQNSHVLLSNYWLAESLWQQGRGSAAFNRLPDADKVGIAHLYANMGLARLKVNDSVEASRLVSKALEVDPGSADAYAAACQIYYAQGSYALAAEACRRAVELSADPHSQAATLFWLGAALAAEGRQADAVEAYERGVALGSDDPSVHENLGRLYTALQRYQLAELQFERAIQVEPARVSAYAALMELCLSKGDTAEAMSWYARARKIAPNSGVPDFQLGMWAYAKQDISGALEAYKRAIEAQPDHAFAWYYLAQIYRQQGQWSEAILAYRQAILSVGPGARFLSWRVDLARVIEKSGDAQGRVSPGVKCSS